MSSEQGSGSVTAPFRRWENLWLWSTPDKFWVESPNCSNRLLQIIRRQPLASTPTGGPLPGTVTVERRDGEKPGSPGNPIPGTATRKQIHGVQGLVDLPLGKFLAVIVRRCLVGELPEQGSVYRVESTELIPLDRRIETEESADQVKLEAHKRCLELLADHLATPYFYFSYSVDLTNTQQRLHELRRVGVPRDEHQGRNRPFWDWLDSRFVWNHNLLESMVGESSDPVLHAFAMPVVHGAVFIKRFTVNRRNLVWAVITRRSRFRVGTRFFYRGADDSGNVANFCETEQLVMEAGMGIASYVQTRGSMPMKWEQTPNIRYKPKPKLVGDYEDSVRSFRLHFQQQVQLYGQQVSVNLIDQKRDEGVMERLYHRMFSQVNLGDDDKLHYEYFDFHKECSKMRYDRLELLMRQLGRYSLGYFHCEDIGGSCGRKPPKKTQTGVFRTNCMDCLDRTNVVQSMLAAENLAEVLFDFAVLSTGGRSQEAVKAFFAKEPKVHEVFRHTWADHANLVSVQYAGTGALKTDFTRTGSRTKWGLLQDGWNSAIRYYKNNFHDGFRTDGMQFYLGDLSKVDVENGLIAAKFRATGQGLVPSLPFLLFLFVGLLVLTSLTSSTLDLNTLGIIGSSLVMVVVIGKVILNNHRFFVDYPLGLAQSRKRTAGRS